MSKIFEVKSGGKSKFMKVSRKKVNIPGFGVLTADELMENEPALVYALSNSHLGGVFSEATEKEFNEFTAAEKELAQKAADEAAKLAAEEEEAEYQKAAAIVEAYQAKYPEKFSNQETVEELVAIQKQYEELTGKKPGNKKVETLLKEIESLKSAE